MTKIFYDYDKYSSVEHNVFYHDGIKTKKDLIDFCLNQIQFKKKVTRAILADGRVYNVRFTKNMNAVAILDK